MLEVTPADGGAAASSKQVSNVDRVDRPPRADRHRRRQVSGASVAVAREPRPATAAPTAGTAISVVGLEKSFGELDVLRGVDFEVARGSVFALLGSNGA